MKKSVLFFALLCVAAMAAGQTLYNVKGKDANNNEESSKINFTSGTFGQVIVGSSSTNDSDGATLFLRGSHKIMYGKERVIGIAPYTPAVDNSFSFRVEQAIYPAFGASGNPEIIPAFNINSNGVVGIGTTDYDQFGKSSGNKTYRLYVKGGIRAEHIKVDLKPGGLWYDHVFNKDYNLMSFAELEAYINAHHHLPDVPSEAEVRANGVDMLEMDAILLKKIEELTLYMLQLQKQNEALKTELDEAKKARLTTELITQLSEVMSQLANLQKQNTELQLRISQLEATQK
jgi:hypothetical protein